MDTYIIRPQEIYLLERYSSPEYFKEMRDAYANMLIAAEQALDIFIHDLPYDLRGRPLNRQYDIVWGERVLPNLRSTLNGLDRGYQALLNGDLSALGYGGNVSGDFRAMGIDYTIDWMPKKQQEEVEKWRRIASVKADNLRFTSTYGWVIGDLDMRYNSPARGSLIPPDSWPIYRLNPEFTVESDKDTVIVSGIYVPNRADASAQVLIEGVEAVTANIGYDPKTMQAIDDLPVTWMLVERIADTGGGNIEVKPKRLRCVAGKPCPQTGLWWSPSNTDSRHFEQGQIMPDTNRSEWLTIWYLNETNRMEGK